MLSINVNNINSAINNNDFHHANKEPRREGSLAAAVNSKPFESLSAVAILVNCILNEYVYIYIYIYIM